MQRKTELSLLLLLISVTLGLRLWQLDSVPPGWRDDELINSLVISQHTLQGDIRPYYADASGHEGLYHILNAGFLAVFGPTPAGIRYLSVILGLITIIYTFLLVGELFGQKHKTTAFIAAFGLTFSFWSLMYSRTGIRHIALPALVLPCFFYFWRWFNQSKTNTATAGSKPLSWRSLGQPLILATICLAAAYYTYFASRGIPLILIAFLVYIALINWTLVRKNWTDLVFFGVVSSLLAIPLYLSIQAQAGADARVAELAVPLIALGEGDFGPLLEHIRITLGMFHATGDGEFLYNIPDRPLFGPVGAALFWAGIAICVWKTLTPLWQRWGKRSTNNYDDNLPFVFLLLWWGAGISPAFISVPPASLSHTILAQSAVYIIAVLPLVVLKNYLANSASPKFILPLGYAILFVLPIAMRDLPDYFVTWPQRGQTRFLYRADIHELADAVVADSLTEFAIGSPLAGPWDKVAFEANLGAAADQIKPRWYNPERVAFISPRISIFGRPKTAVPWQLDTYEPLGTGVGEFNSYRATLLPLPEEFEVCFENDLCLTPQITTDSAATEFDITLQVFVRSAQNLPQIPLISNPPPPNVYAGPRLSVFVQFLDSSGSFVTGDDGFWVDPETLEAGDIFLQHHRLQPPNRTDGDTIAFGMYDPMTGQRILTTDGRDAVHIQADQ